METIFKKIGELAEEEDIAINVTFHSSGELHITVIDYGTDKTDFIKIHCGWSEDNILNCIRDTIRRVKER